MDYLSSESPSSDASSTLVDECDHFGCWICDVAIVQDAHVVGGFDHGFGDPQLELWDEKGLINYEIRSPDTRITLCPTCYAMYNCSDDPGFIFFPADLQFFIDFELNDRERRKNNPTLPRTVPSGEQYRQYLLQNRKISTDSTGCLYRIVLLHQFLLPGTVPATSLMWDGAPMATLRRAFFVLAGGRVGLLDRETRLQLEQLRNLYFIHQDEDEDIRGPKEEPTGEQRKHKHPTEDADDSFPVKKHQLSSDPDGSGSTTSESSSWALGPEYSSNEAIERFGWMFE